MSVSTYENNLTLWHTQDGGLPGPTNQRPDRGTRPVRTLEVPSNMK